MSPPQGPPSATYRVQLTKDFTLRDATALVDYWEALGISDLYASPLLKARAGSVHGYDVVDPRVLNPELGTDEDLSRLHQAAAAHRLGMLLDVVPNHMCVNTNDNAWWNDVLENGTSSPYAKFFDIDWRPPKNELAGKVLLPVLGDQYGKILEAGELGLRERDGAFFIEYYDHRYPVDPQSYAWIFDRVLAALRSQPDVPPGVVTELESIITAARRLPATSDTAPEQVEERQREKEILKARVRAWLAGSEPPGVALESTIAELNGRKGEPHSFDALEELIAQQPYRLSFWRVAAEQINYRRFFEINDLAAIRIEDPDVFEAVHAKVFELARDGLVTGLRIDHVDGLREPRRYLDDLRDRARDLYVVVEKILAPDERLPRTWATEGTSGYELLNHLNGFLIARAGEKPLRAAFDALRSSSGKVADVVYEAKRLILRSSMASELSVLARRLARISEQHRWSRDFTLGTLEHVLAEAIACFPVYRTYVGVGDVEVSLQDAEHVRTAVAEAQRRNPGIDSSTFTFLSDVLLMRDPDNLDDEQRKQRRDFVLRFQQLTGPVMAKGVEDTAFYRYFPLLSLNEVGADLARFGLSVDELHRIMEERARERPGGLSATSTHDTKRGEDSRARLNVLSEIPEPWLAAVERWRPIAQRLKTSLDGRLAPDDEDEYYIYQTLMAALPFVPEERVAPSFRERACGAVEKAIREAKRNTTWINPNTPYEEATRAFVTRALDPAGPLFPELQGFAERLMAAGVLGSLVQLVLKATVPGVPDFFQGTELWDLNMVDPDNRRPVDFARRRSLLRELRERAAADRQGLLSELWARPADGRIKLFLTHVLLDARRAYRELFARGAYVPLVVEGERREQVIAFARRWQSSVAIVVAARFFADLAPGIQPGLPDLGPAFARTSVALPPGLTTGELRDVVTGRLLDPALGPLALGQAFGPAPFAVLLGGVRAPGQGSGEP